MVTVTATDPSGLQATINVTIKVTDADEAPTIMVGGLAVSGTDKSRLRRGQAGRCGNLRGVRPRRGHGYLDA